MNHSKAIAFPLLLALMAGDSGCSSIRSRVDRADADWTAYPGVATDFSDLSSAFEGNLKGPAWTPVVVVPMLLADLPISAAFDTLALPYDLTRIAIRPSETSSQ